MAAGIEGINGLRGGQDLTGHAATTEILLGLFVQLDAVGVSCTYEQYFGCPLAHLGSLFGPIALALKRG